jgi:hypothetical protein
MDSSYELFVRLTKILNSDFRITPVLYGSLGLGKRLEMDMHPKDVDIMIPEVNLKGAAFERIKSMMKKEGFMIYDLHEHEFISKSCIKVAFTNTEHLIAFANIDITKLPFVVKDGANYYLLSLEDYLKVYEEALKDPYRREDEKKKDVVKIQLIKDRLAAGKKQ